LPGDVTLPPNRPREDPGGRSPPAYRRVSSGRPAESAGRPRPAGSAGRPRPAGSAGRLTATSAYTGTRQAPAKRPHIQKSLAPAV